MLSFNIIKVFKESMGMADCKITLEHIELTNTELSNGASLNRLDKTDILAGLSRKAFKNNALKLGYVFDNEINRFVINSNDSNTPVTPRKNKAISIKKDDEKKSLEERVRILEEIVLQGNSYVTSNSFELDSRVLNNDIMTRSIKVSKKAIDAFTTVAEGKLSMYSKQDLISQALIEFADRYK